MSVTIPTRPPQRAGSRKELPRIQTSPSDPKSSTRNGNGDANTPSTAMPSTGDTNKVFSPGVGHARFVLTDHVAFRYLEEDPSVQVLARRQILEGYEIYLVEQWACSRVHPTFLITTYTGDPKDTVPAGILSVPADEATWSPQLKLYFKALDEFHARRKETAFGTLLVTNLSSFPSSLTVIPVPGGDLKKHRELFFVNENLKRLGCSGRSGIKLAPPSSATAAKFHQLYRTSDKIPLNSAVIELVKLCQVSLVMFGRLEPEYADGLLCDVTEKAVNDWWVEFGTEYYNVEPHDGILGPTTVAALLGMFMGARNRLSAYNAPVAKDAFDIESTKRGIGHFQKSQRINKTRRLDRQTLERLRRATAKAASKEGWAAPRALKSAVAELGGKGGEMVMGMVGAGDKAGIAEVETVDIDQFIELVYGERAKWLWYGKPRKTHTGDMFKRLPDEDGRVSPDEQRAHVTARLLKREATLDGHSLTKRDTNLEEEKRHPEPYGQGEGFEKDPHSKRAVIKRATDKIESGSGLRRIKDAVGGRNNQQKPLKEEANGRTPLQHTKPDMSSVRHDGANGSPPSLYQERSKLSSELLSDGTAISSPRRTATGGTDYEPSFTRTLTETPHESASTLAVNKSLEPPLEIEAPTEPDEEDYSKPPTVENSIAGSIYRGIDLNEILPLEAEQDTPLLLRRSKSVIDISHYHATRRDENYWPRHLSFSIAEDSVLKWQSILFEYGDDPFDEADPSSVEAAHAKQLLLTEEAKRLHARLSALRYLDSRWVETRIDSVKDLEAQADADIQELEDMYYPRLDEYTQLREDAHEITTRERLQLQEGIRDLETLGAKLEYEINTLRSKVDDVEDGVAELQRQVEFVEDRARELEEVCGEKEGWLHWMFRISTGIGRPPG
ncbi:hypothetical protein BDV96DRAFT_575801 [Lophiotrema nucula]|uniref:STB6-like N-terminal domain-containing protein n=1 Tax=Lophiotrema nucula TaxID=690887 RepID=A0A6A5Z6S0_9PLEO|nr:hypothetical protein BDV96DRAFT_575801 [Lophiotrema nucula]